MADGRLSWLALKPPIHFWQGVHAEKRCFRYTISGKAKSSVSAESLTAPRMPFWYAAPRQRFSAASARRDRAASLRTTSGRLFNFLRLPESEAGVWPPFERLPLL
jgi:hypothetical protein